MNKDIHFIKKIITVNVVVTLITFIYSQTLFNIYNPYMPYPLFERILLATVKNIFVIVFIVVDIPAAIFIGYYLKPLKDALSNHDLIEKARKRIATVPFVILLIYLAGYLSAPIVAYSMPSGVQLNKFSIVFMLSLFCGIFASSFALFYIDSIMLKVKKLYGMYTLKEEQKEISLNIKYIISVFSLSLLVFSVILYVSYYYYIKQNNADTGNFILNATINAFILAIVGIIQILILNKNVYDTINNIRKAIISIVEGNCDLSKRIDISSFDELGFLTSDVNKLLDFLNNMINKIDNISKNIQESNKFLLDAINNNNNVFNGFIESINDIIEGISGDFHNLRKMQGISEKLTQNTDTINKAIINQTHSVSEASSSIEEMTANIHKVADITINANNDFKKLLNIIEKGKNSLQDAIKSINVIQNSSKDFLGFINTISDISERIKLLAINASIEAARAGKSGEGFAVVALEVRKLSEASSNSVQNIEFKLNEMNEKIMEGTEKINTTAKIIENFFVNTEKSIKLFDEITETMREQEAGTKSIEESSEEVLNSNSVLSELAKNNEEIVNEMKTISDYFYTSTQSIYLLTQQQKEKNQELVKINDNLLNSSLLLKNSIEKLDSILKEFIALQKNENS